MRAIRNTSGSVSLDGQAIIDQASPVPYYFQLGSYIEARIRGGQWRPGESLPSEQEVCNRLGISRTVVRQALAHLEQKGLVAKQNGKLTTVAYPKYEGSLMQDLRGFYEDAAARGQQIATRVLELRVVPAAGEVAAELKIAAGAPVVMLNRLRSLDGQPEVVVVTYLPEALCPGLVKEDFTTRSLYQTLAEKYGLRIAHGYRTIEAIGLDRKDAHLLGVRAGSPGLLLKSVGLLENGTPLEYFLSRHRGDRAKFHVRLVRT